MSASFFLASRKIYQVSNAKTCFIFGEEDRRKQICFNKIIVAWFSQVSFYMKVLKDLTLLLIQLLKKSKPYVALYQSWKRTQIEKPTAGECISVQSQKYSAAHSLSNSRRHSANADVIADVKSKIIVSCRHFFADMIFSATSKFQKYQNKTEEKSLYPSKYVLTTYFFRKLQTTEKVLSSLSIVAVCHVFFNRY